MRETPRAEVVKSRITNHESRITRFGGRPGKVWLIGAGPGDPELLTLKAARALSEADVILVDDLVDRRVLAHARPGTRIVVVGDVVRLASVEARAERAPRAA